MMTLEQWKGVADLLLREARVSGGMSDADFAACRQFILGAPGAFWGKIAPEMFREGADPRFGERSMLWVTRDERDQHARQ